MNYALNVVIRHNWSATHLFIFTQPDITTVALDCYHAATCINETQGNSCNNWIQQSSLARMVLSVWCNCLFGNAQIEHECWYRNCIFSYECVFWVKGQAEARAGACKEPSWLWRCTKLMLLCFALPLICIRIPFPDAAWCYPCMCPSMLDQCSSKSSTISLKTVLCNKLNSSEAGDSVLPKKPKPYFCIHNQREPIISFFCRA